MSTDTLSLARLSRAAPTAFMLEPDAEARAGIVAELGLEGLRKVRLHGEVMPEGKADWRLEATLGATAVQACVVTLDPVTTRIDVPVRRTYMADLPEPVGDELEMPEDDTIEPLPASLNLNDLLVEALALALPDYPRADGVELGEALFTAPGVAPMTDEEAKPLAGLAALRDKLADGGEDPETKG